MSLSKTVLLAAAIAFFLAGCAYFQTANQHPENYLKNIPPSSTAIQENTRTKPKESPLSTLLLFVSYLNAHNYRPAYSLLSRPLQQQMDYPEFTKNASEVKSVRITKVSLFRETGRIARGKVTAEGFEKIRQKNRWMWQKEQYTGEVEWISENGKWHFHQARPESPPARQRVHAKAGG